MNISKLLAASALFASLLCAPAIATAPPSAAAVVDPDGTLARGILSASASRVGTGSYTVTFDDPQVSSSCAYVASIGLSGTSGTSAPGTVGVAAVADGTIAVSTYDRYGQPADLGFHVYVAC